MPIYAYRCAACGHAQDILRKISDPPLVTCTVCNKDAFEKQVTAAGFTLKGTGWYVTDFRGEGGGSKSADGTASAPGTVVPPVSTTAAPSPAPAAAPAPASTASSTSAVTP